ncbi:UNVERIFIED_CONTAM: hypothetical protein RMT77_009351 [Armadillidium vulgare]
MGKPMCCEFVTSVVIVLTMISQGIAIDGANQCYVCLPKYSGSDSTMSSAATRESTNIKEKFPSKARFAQCEDREREGTVTIKKANKDWEVQCNNQKCIKKTYISGSEVWISRSCMSYGLDRSKVVDGKLTTYLCNSEFCNSAFSISPTFIVLGASLAAWLISHFV